jgi:inner membrane organizing system protein 1
MAATESTAIKMTKAEDVLGEKWDRCLVDTGIKMTSGLAIGAVFSLVMFRRRAWPIIFGLGSGFGMGYANCENAFNKPLLQKCKKS